MRQGCGAHQDFQSRNAAAILRTEVQLVWSLMVATVRLLLVLLLLLQYIRLILVDGGTRSQRMRADVVMLMWVAPKNQSLLRHSNWNQGK